MDAEAVQEAVSRIRWFHTIPLGEGIVTPGVDRSSDRLATLGLPHDLRGKTVLDVGAWDGFFSFEAERRGAARVLATDSYCWGGEGWGTKAGFDLARVALGSQVENKEIDVLDLSPASVGMFDVVLFLGVLYHLRNPLLGLERVASVTRELLVVETAVDLVWLRQPAIAFYPGKGLNDDPTNWWGPNHSAVEAMLRDVGFGYVSLTNQDPPRPLAFAHTLLHEIARRAGRPHRKPQLRAVFHARK